MSVKAKRIEQLKALAPTIDGIHRPKALEEEINIACRNVLNGPEGEKVMEYIKSITTSVVLPSTATDAELRMREGMRQLCAILDYRRRSTPET